MAVPLRVGETGGRRRVKQKGEWNPASTGGQSVPEASLWLETDPGAVQGPTFCSDNQAKLENDLGS